MQKGKIINIVELQDAQWGEKVLKKRTITFENFDTGTLTVFPDMTDPKVDDELEYEIVTSQFGTEVKLAKAAGGFKGGGGFKPNPKKEALITASGIVKSMIESKALTDISSIESQLRHFHAVGMDLLKDE